MVFKPLRIGLVWYTVIDLIQQEKDLQEREVLEGLMRRERTEVSSTIFFLEIGIKDWCLIPIRIHCFLDGPKAPSDWSSTLGLENHSKTFHGIL